LADFPETTPEEREALRELKEHSGWHAFRRRLRFMQVEELRLILDYTKKDEREMHESRLRLLREIEVLPQWMDLERGRPLTKEEMKGLRLPPFEADLTEEHLNALD